MKSILLLTYYYPPCNGVPSFRIKSFAETWSKKGFKITVVSRHWNGKENSWEDYMASSYEDTLEIKNENNIEIHRLPYKKATISSSKIKFTKDLYKGNFNKEIDTHQFFDYVNNLVKLNSFDILLCSSPPLNILSLGYKLNKIHNIPWIADLRDFENRQVLKTRSRVAFKYKLILLFKFHYIKKWLNSTLFYSCVSEGIIELLSTKILHNNILIYNGFDKSAIINARKFIEQSTNFEITVLGSIYPEQDIMTFLNGVQYFTSTENIDDLRINFIGIESIIEVSEQLTSHPLKDIIKTLPRIPHDEALRIGNQAQLLYYPGWKGYRGIYSAKIFEYLGLKKVILIAPGDGDVIDKLVTITNSGNIANTSVEVGNIIRKYYNEWKINGNIEYNGENEIIEKYSRENQSIKLLNYIVKELK